MRSHYYKGVWYLRALTDLRRDQIDTEGLIDSEEFRVAFDPDLAVERDRRLDAMASGHWGDWHDGRGDDDGD